MVLDIATLLPIAFNDQVCRQLGYSRDEFADMRIQDHEAYRGQGEIAHRVAGIADSGEDTFTTRQRTKGGERRDVVVTVKRMSVAGSDVLHATVRDVTGSRRAEEAARHIEAQIHQAQLMEAVGRLAGEMARDFNHSQTTILGICNLALNAEDIGPFARHDVEEIKRVAHRATALAGRLLSFARREGGTPIRLDLNAAASDLGQLLEPTLGPGVALNLDLCEAPLPVDVEPSDLDDALMNLAVNALDALPEGGQIDLATREQVVDPDSALREEGIPAGRYAVVEVRDCGVGMDAETARRIYEPFFTTKPAGTAAGLGLSIVYGTVQRSGGHIRVDTASGLGTTVTLYLPLAPAAEVPTVTPMEATPRPGVAPRTADTPRAAVAPMPTATPMPVVAPMPAATDSAPGNETVLVVEDEPGVRKLVERVLGQEGYTVLAAGSARDAFELILDAPSPVDLVVTDVVMPDVSGPELVATLRRDHPSLRVLFMSGYARTALARAATFAVGKSRPPASPPPADEGRPSRRAGGGDAGPQAPPLEIHPLDDFLEKPFTPDSLAAAVRRALDGRAAAVGRVPDDGAGSPSADRAPVERVPRVPHQGSTRDLYGNLTLVRVPCRDDE